MTMGAKTFAWLIVALCVGGSASAQEKIQTPSQKSKDAVDKFNAAPSAVGKKLQDLGKSVSAKLGLGQDEVKPEATEVPQADKESAESKPSISPTIATRDPFRPFTLNTKRHPRPLEKLTPLERFELGQLKLVGIIWDIKQPNAIVEDATGLGYVVKVGTPIGSNEGKIKSIQPAGLVIEEYQFDVYGAKKKVERSMRLVPEKAE